MSEYAKNIQTIEDLWKKRIELRDEGGEEMSEYKVTIKITETYTVKVEARTESDAIAKAFDNRYGWVYQCDTDLYEVKAEVVGE